MPFLGEVPLISEVVEGGDSGVPIILSDPESPASKAYISLAGQVAAQISINQAKEQKVDATFEMEWKN